MQASFLNSIHVLNWASCIFCVQNLASLPWDSAQTPFCKLVQPSCSCWEGWLLTAHGCPRFLPPPSLQMEPPCPPGYLQRSANDWWMWRDRVSAKGQSPCLKEGQLQDETYAPGASARHPPPGIRSKLELTWGHILSFSILLLSSP